MNNFDKRSFTVINGGREELERRLVATFFTPYLPDNTAVADQLEEQLKPRIASASLTLVSQELQCGHHGRE
jgi:hypothetical protein